MAVLGSPSLIVPVVSVDVTLTVKWSDTDLQSMICADRVQELCGSRGGRPGLPVPNSPCGFCGRNIDCQMVGHRLTVHDLC